MDYLARSGQRGLCDVAVLQRQSQYRLHGIDEGIEISGVEVVGESGIFEQEGSECDARSQRPNRPHCAQPVAGCQPVQGYDDSFRPSRIVGISAHLHLAVVEIRCTWLIFSILMGFAERAVCGCNLSWLAYGYEPRRAKGVLAVLCPVGVFCAACPPVLFFCDGLAGGSEQSPRSPQARLAWRWGKLDVALHAQ